MGGRGTFASGKSDTPYTYRTVGKIEGIKVLEHMAGGRKLPEEAHSSRAYALLNPDGTLRVLRFYDAEHRLRYEIAYHREPNIDPAGNPVLHYHVYDVSGKGRWHGPAIKATKAMRKRYGKYFGRKWR